MRGNPRNVCRGPLIAQQALHDQFFAGAQAERRTKLAKRPKTGFATCPPKNFENSRDLVDVMQVEIVAGANNEFEINLPKETGTERPAFDREDDDED